VVEWDDRAQVDAFWRAGIDAGYRDSVEAVRSNREEAVPDGGVDHLWIRVRDPQASRRFYTMIAPYAGLWLTHDEPGRVQLSGRSRRS
jgi:hypothetical protein